MKLFSVIYQVLISFMYEISIKYGIIDKTPVLVIDRVLTWLNNNSFYEKIAELIGNDFHS